MKLIGTTNLWTTDMWAHIWVPGNWLSWHVDHLPGWSLHTVTVFGFVFKLETRNQNR